MHKESVYPPPAEYLYINLSNNVLNIDSNGEHVVLARFPEEGKNLEAFGLNPSNLKSIAIPNDLREWPTTALSGCIALQKIDVYGEEVDAGTIELTHEQGLHHLTKLASVWIPSTITSLRGGSNAETPCRSVFSPSLKCVHFSKNLEYIQSEAFYQNSLSSFDFNPCKKLGGINSNWAFGYNSSLQSLDFSQCSNLKVIGYGAFEGCSQLRNVVFPSSLINIRGHAFIWTPLRTVVWMGRSTRLPDGADNFGIHTSAFGSTSLADQVANGTITEIFIL